MKKEKRGNIPDKEFRGAERRKFPRISEELVFRYFVVSGKDKKVYSKPRVAKTKDISLGGLNFKTKELIVDGLHISSETTPKGPLRNYLVLQLQLPGFSSNIKVSAEVAWYEVVEKSPSPTYAVGIKFINMAPEHRKSINKYVKKTFGDTAPLKV